MPLVSPNTLVRGPDGTTHKAGDLARLFGVAPVNGRIDVPQGSIVQQTPPRSGQAHDLSIGPGGITATPVVDTSGNPVLTRDRNFGTPPAPPQQTQAELDRAANNARNASSAALILRQYGLEALIPIVDSWIRGGMSWEEAQLAFYDTSTEAGKIFDTRFPAIRMRREANLAPISPADYVAYEGHARQLMRAAGLPEGFYDTPDDYTNLLAGDVSLSELNDRINQGFIQVQQAPPEVREAFSEYFGSNGDAALASYFLDPERAVPVLAEEVEIAKIGGASKAFGFQLDKGRAKKIAGTDVSFTEARSAFGNLRSMEPLFTESVSEGVDLTAEGEGVDAAFGLDQGQAAKKLSRRLEERVGTTQGAGGAAAGESGVFGLGSARR